MFTLLVLWLLVAFIPGVLMLVTLGLGRLEKALARASVTATDAAEFEDHAKAVGVRTLVRDGMPDALEYLHPRQALELEATPRPITLTGRHHAETCFAADVVAHVELGRSTHILASREARYRTNTRVTVNRHY